ncbi:YihY/virulence factor BrkB family protein [Ramlibacter sp.]|uniref:YihY/virulence factor BrkB family protein n=1 Tax=Ramlibacter sp. TaxID=1917967 RepID=UPI0018425FB0|nr:YihY/virulence factor BrkB family protein [Ramlibacter sp.]MBA2676421.1 YihY/virulence factor BrkB family protein [Ramlibacter sp.]
MQPKHLFQLFVKAAKAWSDDYAPSMGAAISYYTVFSLAPLLVIVIAIAGAVFGREAVQGQIVAQLSGMIGQQGAEMIQTLIAASSDKDKGLVAGLISAGVLLVGATTVFAELQSALDRIWHVPESQKPQGIKAVLRARLLSFGMILGLVFLLMVSLMVSTAVAAFGTLTNELMPGMEALLYVVNIAVSLGIGTVLFAMIYKFMPSTRIGWSDVWVGAIATAVLFEVGKFLIGLYIGKSGMTESFAAAGSLVVLIAWVYYAAQIFLLGAEFTKVYAQDHGTKAGEAQAQAQTQAGDGDAQGIAPAKPRLVSQTPDGTLLPMPVPATAAPAVARAVTEAKRATPAAELPRPLTPHEETLVKRTAYAGLVAFAGLAAATLAHAMRRRPAHAGGKEWARHARPATAGHAPQQSRRR